MNNEIEFDHFKDINELLKNIDSWYREDDIEYTRWFGLTDLHNLKIYITYLQQKVEQLENKIKYAQKIEQEYSALLTENTELENIRKEAIEYINKNWGHWCSNHCEYATETINILNKGSDKQI